MGFFDDIADAFSKNGAVTRFCENIPVVGHATAGIQALAGNTEEAKRGLATSTGNLCSAVGAVAGIAGGPVGVAAGGALGGLVGSFVTAGLASTIDDPGVKGDLDQISVGKVAMDMGFGAASGLLPGSGSVFSETGKSLGKELAKEAGKDAVKISFAAAASQGLKGLNQQGQYASGDIGPEPGPTVDDDDEDPEEKTKIISQDNEDRIHDCVEHLEAMRVTFGVTAVSGPAYNTMGQLDAIKKGQNWEAGSAEYHKAWAFFDARWEPTGQYFQGGKPQAIEALLAQGGWTTADGVKMESSREELQSLLDKAETELKALRVKADVSLATKYDLV